MGHILFEGLLICIILIGVIMMYLLVRLFESMNKDIEKLEVSVTSQDDRLKAAENWIELAVPWMKNTQHRISLLKTKVQKMHDGAIVLKDEEDTAELEEASAEAASDFAEALAAADTVAGGLRDAE